MMDKPFPGSLEPMVLPAVIRPHDAARGIAILRALEAGTDREVGDGSVCAALERLEAKGLVDSRLGDPTPERGGRAKRYFRATADGGREARSTGETRSLPWQVPPRSERGCA